MADDFVPAGGNSEAPAVTWSAVSSTGASTFVPFPSSGQDAVPEVGYSEGGYSEGGYDTPAVPATNAAATAWTSFTTR